MARSPSRAEASRALLGGHRITLIKGGVAFFAALVEAIDAARAEVLLETYIFDFHGGAVAIAEALERAAARKLTVRVVVDGFGTPAIPVDWQERWTRAGVHWRVFSPGGSLSLLRPGHWRRLHRKLAVVDAAVAFCGG
ncbi:MAG TPA: phospholipase D-like domain-containing protein, partial [Caldimonas sp.]|nr:phospholipase D-like domain-containing protein [Caldimonas sp.]